MATGPCEICPICQETLKDITYMTSCYHQFCLGCIVHWTKNNPSCPLCRQPLYTLIFPVQSDQEFLEMVPLQLSSPLTTCPQAEQGAPESASMAYVAGFPAKTWALFFQNYAEILEPVQLWMEKVLLATCWWDVALVQGRIISYLCCYGLDEELLVRELRPFLWEHTVMFMHQLIDVAVEQCYERIQLLMDQRSSHEAEVQSHTSRGPGDAPEGMAATNASTQEEPHEELEQVVEDNSNLGQSSSWGQAQEPLK